MVQHKANIEVVDGTNNISCNSMHRDFIKCLKKEGLYGVNFRVFN